jgi:hypothetical protein
MRKGTRRRTLRASLRKIREFWYRVAYNGRGLSWTEPLAVQDGTLPTTDTAIRWISSVRVGGLSKHSLLVHPPARVSFRCKVPRRGLFQTFVAVTSEGRNCNYGTTEFAVEIAIPDACPAVVYRRCVCLPHDLQQANWKKINVRLGRFVDREIELRLAAMASHNGSKDYVWSVWGEPTLLVRKPLREIWIDLKQFFAAYSLVGSIVESVKLLTGQVVRSRAHAVTLPVQVRSPANFEMGNDKVRAEIKRESVALSDDYRKVTVAIYASSRGNYFFREIGSLLVAGFRELGCSVDLRNEKDGFVDDVNWHIVVAPHEFFYLGHGIRLGHGPLPSNLILLNTEQPSTKWFSKAYRFFSSAPAIWDMNHLACKLIRSRGFPASYLPLGYVPDFEPFREVKELPRHDATRSLGTEVLQRSFLNAPISQRPIDVLFIGYLSPRRAEFFARAEYELSKYRCYFHFSHGTTPVVSGENTHMNTMTAIGLAQRAKIVLNIHHGEDKYFEWHRVVMHGLWQKALVVSEAADVAPPFEAGRDFVATGLDDITEQIAFYLSSVEGQERAQTIADCGYRTLSEKCRLSECLRGLLADLRFDVAAAQPVCQISI